MEGEPQAQAEQTATAVPEKPGTDNNEQPTLENANLDELDQVQTQAATIAGSKPAGSESTEGKLGEPAKEEPVKDEKSEPEKAEPVVETGKEEHVESEEQIPPVEDVPEKPVVTPEPEATGELPERFRFKNPKDKAIAAVYKAAEAAGTPVTWAEAERRVVGEPVAPAEALPDPVAVASTTIEALTTEIADLERQINPDGEEEVLSTKEMRAATVKLAEKRATLTEAKQDLKDAQRAEDYNRSQIVNKQREARAVSVAKAREKFPDAGNGETVLGKAITQRFEEMKNPSHPDHPILYADTAPERVTEIVAAELGIAPKPKSAPTAKPTAQPAAPAPKKATPVSGGKTAVPEKPAEVKDDKRSVEYLQSDKASLAELDSAMGADRGIATAVR